MVHPAEGVAIAPPAVAEHVRCPRAEGCRSAGGHTAYPDDTGNQPASADETRWARRCTELTSAFACHLTSLLSSASCIRCDLHPCSSQHALPHSPKPQRAVTTHTHGLYSPAAPFRSMSLIRSSQLLPGPVPPLFAMSPLHCTAAITSPHSSSSPSNPPDISSSPDEGPGHRTSGGQAQVPVCCLSEDGPPSGWRSLHPRCSSIPPPSRFSILLPFPLPSPSPSPAPSPPPPLLRRLRIRS